MIRMSAVPVVPMKKISLALLMLLLLVAASGCKKKVPPPPPPPPPSNVPSTPPPSTGSTRVVINSFSAEPSRIDKGQGATLRWSISNATDMQIDQGLGAVQSQGTRQVYPSATTTYTLVANGPGGGDTRSVTVEVTTAPAPPAATPTGPSLTPLEILNQQGQDAYFDYDSSDIRADARQALTTDADILKRVFARDPNLVVIIEGHADERGSAEYNLGLGDRRATAAREYLVQLGVPAERLKTISYGKEKPQCTEATEDCYQKNRRAHLTAGQ